MDYQPEPTIHWLTLAGVPGLRGYLGYRFTNASHKRVIAFAVDNEDSVIGTHGFE